MSQPYPLTVEQFQDALPAKVKKSVNQELIDAVNATLSEPELYEIYRDNLLSYTRVMNDGRFKVQEYVAAVKYVSHKLMGDTNIAAYSRVFPDKIARFNAQGVAAKDIASYVTAYNKSKLVNLVLEQTLVPNHVLNQDQHQKAINHLAVLMISAKSEKVQVEAAIGLINATKAPDVKKVELDISHKEDSSIVELRKATMELAAQQRLMIQAGATTAQDVAHSRIVDAEVMDVEVKP